MYGPTLAAFCMAECLDQRQAETFLGWHRKGFQLLWRSKSRPRGRPRLREEIQKLIQRMARENSTWGEERIAAELLLKLHIRVSPRTVRRYMPLDTGPRKRVPSQRWMTFVRQVRPGASTGPQGSARGGRLPRARVILSKNTQIIA